MTIKISNKLPRYLLNLIFLVMPPTRLFEFKKFLTMLAGIRIASGVKINSECKFIGNGHIEIGDNTWVGIGAEFIVPECSTISIGSNCDIGPRVKFICGSHHIGNSERRAGIGISEDITIGSGVWIGAGTLILHGVNISDGTVVAAGSVLRKGSYPPNALIAGNPSIIKKYYVD